MKIKPTAADVIMEILSLVLMIGVSLYIFIRWSSIPDKIPMHYNFAGEIDRWGGKGELLFLIAIAWGIWLLITVTERFPKFWNTGVEVTEKNREHVYRTLKYMVKTMKLIIVIIFTYLILHTLTVRNLPGWFFFGICGAADRRYGFLADMAVPEKSPAGITSVSVEIFENMSIRNT